MLHGCEYDPTVPAVKAHLISRGKSESNLTQSLLESVEMGQVYGGSTYSWMPHYTGMHKDRASKHSRGQEQLCHFREIHCHRHKGCMSKTKWSNSGLVTT